MRNRILSSTEIDKITPAYIKVQNEITNPKLNKTNPHFKNRYADLASILKYIRPLLAKHKLAVVQSLSPAQDGSIGLSSTLLHESGQWFQSQLIIPPQSGKATDYGSSISYMRRYDLCTLLGIVGDDDDDATQATRAANKEGKSPGKMYAQAAEAIMSSGDMTALAENEQKVRDRFRGAEQKELLSLAKRRRNELEAEPDASEE